MSTNGVTEAAEQAPPVRVFNLAAILAAMDQRREAALRQAAAYEIEVARATARAEAIAAERAALVALLDADG